MPPPGPWDASLRNCVVLLDTSASMNQRTATNLSLLDIAKAGIEHMVRRFPTGLKFLLVTTRNGGTVESGWQDSQEEFLVKVKNMVARDLSNLPGALRCAFDTLEQRRSNTDLESYGFGRQPWVTGDAASVWVITDGCSMNHEGTSLTSFVMPKSEAPASNIFTEPFRWDQRVWITVLRCPGRAMQIQSQELSSNTGPIAVVSEMTGARAQVVQSMRQLTQAVDSLSQRLTGQSVAIRLVPLHGSDSQTQNKDTSSTGMPCSIPTSTTLLTLASVPSLQMGFSKGVTPVWPIPEPFILTEYSPGVVPRPAVPTIAFQLVVPPPPAGEGSLDRSTATAPGAADWKEGGWNDLSMLQPDIYDVEQCAVTEYLVNKCKELKTSRAHLLVYVRGSNTPATAATVANAIAAASAAHDGTDSLRAQLEEFAASRDTLLEMSASLTPAERARVHQIAGALGLRHQSVGEGPSRYLRISKAGSGDAGPEGTSAADGMDLDQEPWPGDKHGASAAAAAAACAGRSQLLPAGEPFGLMRLVVGDAGARRASAASGVELVLLPYNFSKLMELVAQQTREAACLRSSGAHPKPTQAAALALSSRTDMLEFYRALPLCYLKPLRAVLRKAAASAASPVQLTMPEFREQQQVEDGSGARAAGAGGLPIVALPAVVKTQVQHLKMEKAKAYEKSGAVPPASFAAGMVDDAIEQDGGRQEAARLARRMRGGTPALFRSLGGDQGNYGSGDLHSCNNSKAALAVNPFNIPRANLLVHLRRMRLALLGQAKAARVDKLQVASCSCLVPGASLPRPRVERRRFEGEEAASAGGRCCLRTRGCPVLRPRANEEATRGQEAKGARASAALGALRGKGGARALREVLDAERWSMPGS